MQFFPIPNLEDAREVLGQLLALAFCCLILFAGISLNETFKRTGGPRR